MHSKVIIASLACVLAASLANSRTTNISVNAQQPRAEEARCCKAPNEDGINAVLYADKPYQSNDFCLFLQGLEYQSAMASHMDILRRSSGLTVYPLAYNPVYGYYYNVAQPTSDGDYYVTYGAYGKEVATIYIYRSNGICYGSTLSKFDARAKYFKNEVATSSELSYYPQNWGNSYSVNSTTAVNALKHYGTYIYSGTSDITMGLTTTQRSGWNDFGSNLSIKVHVEMYKDGTFYPVESARVRLLSSGTELGSATKRTNSSGNYTYSMSLMDTFNKTLGNIQVGISTDTAQAIIRDNNGLDYPYFYTTSSSTNLFTLKTIQYNIKIYPERSDRAAAYEVSQAELVPYKYTNYYSGSSVSAAKVLFPAEKTSYYTSFDNYLGVSANNLIAIKKAHSNVWDVMNHEYGHYISDILNLSMDPSNDIYWTHTYNEDLIHTYDFEQGRRIAYSEGLATYLGVAAQLDYATRVNPSSYCATIADEKYVDPVNGVDANFGAYRYGLSSGFYGQGVESSIPSAMIKFLDNVSRNNDDVALGHQKMWNAIRAAGSNTADILTFDSVLVSQNPSLVNAIYAILDIEFIPHDPAPTPDTSWTVMLYMCGANTMSQLDEIENVGVQQPNDVNVIVETDININTGFADNYLHRYTLRNGTFQPYGGTDGRITRTNMGLKSTFQDFLCWGVEEFLADNMGLILYNHGHGLEGVCFDNYGMASGQEDSLRSSEIAAACATVFNANNIDKFEFIGYDACVMQVQDVAEYNSPYFKYQIASEEEESLDMGWAYDEWIDDLFTHTDIETMMIKMCDGLVDAGCNYETSWGLTLSALDLSKMATYKAKFEQLASAMYSAVNANRDEFYNVITNSFPYGVYASNSKLDHGKGYGMCDCGGFLRNLKNSEVFSSFGNLIDQVSDAYEQLVVYSAGYGYNGGFSASTGMSIQHLIYPEYHVYPSDETHFNNWRNLF